MVVKLVDTRNRRKSFKTLSILDRETLSKISTQTHKNPWRGQDIRTHFRESILSVPCRNRRKLSKF